MPEISYKDLKKYLRDREDRPFEPIYLIYGEEMLVKTAFDDLLNALVPASNRSMNYEPLDGANVTIHEVIGRINTFSLIPGKKVVAFLDSRVFYAGHEKGRLLANAQKALKDDDIKKAAGYLLSMMAHLNLSFDDLSISNREVSLGLDWDSATNSSWLDGIIAYCRENNLSVPAVEDDSRILQDAVEKGFPKDNHLILTTDLADKRRTLYKTISTRGLAIDCTVPKGNRRADRIVQEAVVVDKMNSILQASGKTIDKNAYTSLYEMTGFDLRTFCNNLEKLISYVGDRNEITLEDVEFILKRTKKDPIYELTNALADRNIELSLFFLNSILGSGIHPLQVLAAISNQIRKLLVIKDFIGSQIARDWQPACTYNYFQTNVVPAIVTYDRQLIDCIGDWDRQAKTETVSKNDEPGKNVKKKARHTTTDLVIAKNPKNAYPIFQLFKKSEQFSEDELIYAVESLNKADVLLKSSTQPAKLIIENVVLAICKDQRHSD